MRNRAAALFCVSASALLLEISLTRILSVATWYHFAFMVISLALLGFATAGSYLAGGNKRTDAAIAGVGALVAVGGCWACAIVPSLTTVDPFALLSWTQWLSLIVYEAAIGAAFFGAGLTVSSILSGWPREAGPLYCASSLGSALGCVLAPGLIARVAAQGAVLAAAAGAAAAAWAVCEPKSRRPWIAAAALASLALALPAARLFPVRVAASKLLGNMQAQGFVPAVTLHNAFSQIDAFETRPGEAVYAPGAPAPPTPATLPPQYPIVIDGDAVTALTKPGPAGVLDELPGAVVYHLRPKAKVCVIGAGGGFDVLTALSVGKSPDVTAVEINPNIASLVADRYDGFTGGLYRDRRVRLRVADGRAFLRDDENRYDALQLSLVDTWAAASRGAYSLTENYLYTVEAFEGYLAHLRPQGILSVNRWFLRPPNEILRLEALALEALARSGVRDPSRCLAIVVGGRANSSEREVATLLAKREPFAPGELKTLTALCRRTGLRLLYAPGAGGGEPSEFAALAAEPRLFVAAYPLDLEPPVDDKPFFFQAYGLRQFSLAKAWRAVGVDRNAPSFLVLVGALAETVALSMALIAWPLRRARADAGATTAAMLVAFAGWGLGFMLFEIAALQKLALVLGNPVYSIAVALSSLLLWAGIGGRLSTAIRGARQLAAVIGVAAGVLLLEPILLDALPRIVIGFSPRACALCCGLALAPAGLLMGCCVPTGLRLGGGLSPRTEAWAWAANGCLSVVGSALAALLSISIGFDATIRLAAAVYLIGLLAVLRLAPSLSAG